MKKFALTAIALAMFSGSALASATILPPSVDGVVVIPNNATVHAAEKDGKIVEGVVGVKYYDAEKRGFVTKYVALAEETKFVDSEGNKKGHFLGMGEEAAQNAQDKIDSTFNGGSNQEITFPRPAPGSSNPAGTGEGDMFDDMGVKPDHNFGNGEALDPEVDGGHTHPGERPDNKPTPNLAGGISNNANNIAAMGEAFEQRVDVVNGYLSQAGQAIANNSAAIQNNSDRITNLESAFEQQAAHTAKEISRLDDRIDGIGAMSQAVTAARPQLFGNQTSAIGMGIGHMGDATALAAGYVHRINENWSANANISTTFGTDDRDTSVGAGVAYAW